MAVSNSTQIGITLCYEKTLVLSTKNICLLTTGYDWLVKVRNLRNAEASKIWEKAQNGLSARALRFAEVGMIMQCPHHDTPMAPRLVTDCTDGLHYCYWQPALVLQPRNYNMRAIVQLVKRFEYLHLIIVQHYRQTITNTFLKPTILTLVSE